MAADHNDAPARAKLLDALLSAHSAGAARFLIRGATIVSMDRSIGDRVPHRRRSPIPVRAGDVRLDGRVAIRGAERPGEPEVAQLPAGRHAGLAEDVAQVGIDGART